MRMSSFFSTSSSALVVLVFSVSTILTGTNSISLSFDLYFPVLSDDELFFIVFVGQTVDALIVRFNIQNSEKFKLLIFLLVNVRFDKFNVIWFSILSQS